MMTMYTLLLQHANELTQFQNDRKTSLAQLQERQLLLIHDWVDEDTSTKDELRKLLQVRQIWDGQWCDCGWRLRKLKEKQQAEIEELENPTTMYGSFTGKDGKVYYYEVDEEADYQGFR